MEQRRYERVRVSLYIDWGFNSACAQQARLTSFCVGGCFVQTGVEAETGQAVYLRLSLPEAHVLHGEVRYHMSEVGFGVEFKDVTIEDQLKLEALVEYYRGQAAEQPPATT